MSSIQDRLKVVKAMAVMAWSDGRMDEREAKAIRTLAKRMDLDAHGRSVLEGYLLSRPSLDGVQFDDLSDKEREALMLAAVHFAYLDGNVAPAERQVLVQFARRLQIDDDQLGQMERQAWERLGGR
ncbi:MAG: TerB family tellurite resistance protein [Deltaproteobacteria bacterium]|nr:TerB family tellurite resistance protein [Deltaproteobacteria bacterium]